MILTIDAGNTRIKGAVFENSTLVSLLVFDPNQIAVQLEKVFHTYPKIQHMVVASVGKLQKEIFSSFENRTGITFITHQSKFPYTNQYQTPLTLGIDRMVLAAGAVLHFPNQNRLVIDAGSCITYDFVDAQDNYLGGAISPGLQMRYSALHHFTAKLPLLSIESPKDFIGQSTQEAMHSGVVNGMVHEINGFIATYEQHYSNFTIILTGGDTVFLAKRLKNTIFANSNFLLESLDRIFQYKTEND